MEKIFRPFVRWMIRYYWLLLALGVAAAGLSLPRVIHLFKHISTDFVDLLPRDFPSVQNLLKIRDQLQPKRRFFLLMESADPQSVPAHLEDLKKYLESDPAVGKVYIKKEGFEFFKKHQLFYLSVPELQDIRDRIDRKIQQEKLGGLYVSFTEDDKDFDLEELKEEHLGAHGIDGGEEYFLSPNGKIYGMVVESKQPNLNLSQETAFQNQVKKRVDSYRPAAPDPSLKITFSGSPRVLEYRALIHDLKVAGVISGVLIFLPLLLRFRRPHYVLGVFFPLVLGIPLGLALSSIWIPQLNVTTSFLFGILGGLGVETGIHLFSRYYENRRAGKDLEDSLLDLYVSLGPAVLTAVSALAVTFLLMTFGNFRGFTDFGFISGVGLYVLFVMYFTVFPAGLVLMEKFRAFRWAQAQSEPSFQMKFTPGFIRVLLGMFTLLTLLCLAVIPKLQFEYDTRKIRADAAQEVTAKVKQRAVWPRRPSPGIVMIRDEKQSEALEAALEKEKLDHPHSVLDLTRSIYSMVPKQQDEKLVLIRQMIDLLSDDAVSLVKGRDKEDLETFKKVLKDHRTFTRADVPKDVQRYFLGDKKNSQSFFMIYPKPWMELDEGRNAIRFAEEVEQIRTSQGTFGATSDAIVFADVIRTLFVDARRILVISAVSILFFVFLNFRNVRMTAMVMLSIFAGVLWVMGILYLMGIKFNLYNMEMIPAIMGMSIDNSIHICHRYEELGKGSLGRVLGTTGVSALLASMTNAAGFIGLVFCTHGGLRSMGVIVLLGLGACLVTTLVYLPMMLEALEKRKASAALPQCVST